MRLAELMKETRTIEIEFAGQKALVTYRLFALTPAMNAEIFNGGEKELATKIVALVEAWDLVDADDKVAPLEVDYIHNNVPQVLLYALLFGILTDAGGKNSEKKS